MNRIDDLIHELCPNGVPFKSVAELGLVYGGLTGKSKQDFQAGNSRYVPYTQVFHYLKLETLPEPMVVTRSHERQTAVRRGDVLFTASSEQAEEVGMSCAVTSSFEEDVYLNSFCFGLRFHDPDQLRPEFAMYLFRSSGVRRQIVRTANGVTRFNISKKRFSRVVVPVPPLEVQDEIVRILDAFTNLTAELEAELEARRTQYEHYREALLIGDLAPQAEWATLGEIGRVAMCKRIFKSQTASSGEVPFFKIGTFGKEPDAFIERSLFDEYREKFSYPRPGDVLISASGTIGRAIVYDGQDSYFQDSNIVWLAHSEDRVLNRYLYHWYKIIEWATDTGGTIRRLYNKNILKARIRLPSLAEQERIAHVLDGFELLTSDLTSGLPAEIEARRKQYEYYRDRLLAFDEVPT